MDLAEVIKRRTPNLCRWATSWQDEVVPARSLTSKRWRVLKPLLTIFLLGSLGSLACARGPATDSECNLRGFAHET